MPFPSRGFTRNYSRVITVYSPALRNKEGLVSLGQMHEGICNIHSNRGQHQTVTWLTNATGTLGLCSGILGGSGPSKGKARTKSQQTEARRPDPGFKFLLPWLVFHFWASVFHTGWIFTDSFPLEHAEVFCMGQKRWPCPTGGWFLLRDRPY